jgi:hypothetical protein
MTNKYDDMDKSEPLVDVRLYLRGDLLDPAQVSYLLGAEGSKMRVKGEQWRTSTNHEVTSKIGLWVLDAKADSHSLSDQIAFLREKLGLAKCSPLQIPGVQEAEICVFVALGSDDEGDGDYESELTSEDLSWLSGLGASVSFKLSFTKS